MCYATNIKFFSRIHMQESGYRRHTTSPALFVLQAQTLEAKLFETITEKEASICPYNLCLNLGKKSFGYFTAHLFF